LAALTFLSKLVYPSYFVWHLPSTEKVLYLTFDDGPTPQITSNILQCLSDYDVKATFFCVGRNVEKHPELFQKILKNGHQVGNHTFSHLNGWHTKTSVYEEDVKKASQLIQSNLFRPPYGRITYKQAKALKNSHKIIMWSGLTYDFNQNITPQKCLHKAIKNTYNGSIIVFHDNIKSQQNMLFALPQYLTYCLNNGFEFRTIQSDTY